MACSVIEKLPMHVIINPNVFLIKPSSLEASPAQLSVYTNTFIIKICQNISVKFDPKNARKIGVKEEGEGELMNTQIQTID